MSSSAVYVTKANQLVGAAVEPANTLVAVDSTVRDAFVAAAAGLAVDKFFNLDIATGAYAKQAWVVLNFTGTTAITIDLTDLVAATGVQVAGVTSFSTWNRINLTNPTGGSTCTISFGSNPIHSAFAGTSPTFALATGEDTHWFSAAGQTVDSTHKTITFTPTSGGTLLIGIGGA